MIIPGTAMRVQPDIPTLPANVSEAPLSNPARLVAGSIHAGPEAGDPESASWPAQTTPRISCGLSLARAWLAMGLLFGMLAGPVFGAEGGKDSGSVSNLFDMSLEQLMSLKVVSVYGASKYEQELSDAPSSVSIVTRDEMQKQGHRTLAEVLQGVRGMNVTSDRAYSYLGIRGFGRPSDYNSRVLLLVDGHRMNDNLYDAAMLGTEGVLDVDLMERVEVIRGPSSSIYGDNAFFGVVNVITRSGAKINGLEVSGEAGAFETYKGRVTYGKHFTNGLDLVISGSWSDSEGEDRLYYREFNQPESNNGIARNSDDDDSRRVFSRIAYGDFTLSGAWSWRGKTIPTASYETIFNDGGEKVTDRYAYLDLKFARTFARDIAVEGKVYYDNYRYTGDYPYNTAPPGDPLTRLLNSDIASGEWAGMNWQLTAPIGERIKVVTGVDFRGDIRRQQVNYDVDPRAIITDVDNSSWNAGIYTQGEWEICSNLVFNGGVRLDYYETFGSTVNPRLGLIYRPWTKTNFKLLYGQAFRAPNASETYFGNPNPETVRTYELVWDQELPANHMLTVVGYYYQVRDLISENGDNFENLGHVNAQGLEAELSGNYAHGIQARLSYALQGTEDQDMHAELSNSPRHLVKGSLIVPLHEDKIFAGVELQFTGRTLSNSRRPLDDYLVVNATLFSQKLAHNLELSASVYNVFGTRYSHAVSAAHLQDSIEQPGRSFRVKLTFLF